MSIGGLIALLLIWGAIVAVVAVFVIRRATPGAADPGSSGRRSFQYFLLIVLLFMTATGAAQLLAVALPGDDTLAGSDPSDLASPLALVVVGLPSYVLLAWWIRRTAIDDAAERASGGWSAYVNGALIISLLVSMGAAIATLSWIIGAADYESVALAFLLVYGGVWLAHWILGHRDLPEPRTQPHLAVGSAAGLLTMSISVAVALAIALSEIYDQLFSTVLSSDFSESIRLALSFVIVGTLVWWWHWLRHYSRFERTEVWNAYVLLLGVLGGLVAAISSAGGALFGVLQWFLGNPSASSAAAHFEFLPGVVAAGLIGASVWWYHRAVLRASGGDERTEVDRVYQYLLSGLGLATTTVGVTTVVVALIAAITPEPIAGSGPSEIDVLLAAVTALLIGAPIWWLTWSSIQNAAKADPETELASPTRNLYLLLLFGLGGIIALVSLVAVMVTAFGAVLDGTFGGTTIYDMRVGVALLITVGLVAAYHWSIWRSDREQLPDSKATKTALRDVVLLAPEGVDATRVGEATGASLRVMRRLDDVEVDIDRVIEAINASEDDRIIVLTGADGAVQVIPVGGLRRQ